MPTEKEFEDFFNDYMFWAIEYDKSDPPVYSRAADILLAFLQKHSKHPCVYFDYQLESLTHFIREVHKVPIGLESLTYLVKKLLLAADNGKLGDTRINSN